MRPHLSEAQGRLLRALIKALTGSEPIAPRESPVAIVELCDSSDWASLTFSGQRHRIVLAVGPVIADAATERLASGLTLPGVVVAEVRITGAENRDDAVALTIAVMTIDDRR